MGWQHFSHGVSVMLEIEIDGKKAAVPEGCLVIDAARQLGVYIPHFCYHKKLSIAASCRMCLVEVENSPKPVPACATPVTAGMKVFTHSPLAVEAQKGVMEFLLANHPLDCPICDQGGECQLQDLAVGYGAGRSRYCEEKRVVFKKDAGPLVAMVEMSRCIHCTRCVRFGQEIAGIMELGMAGRNSHAEIETFLGRSVESELSGNMIDLCPVGALTSRPFRYSARGWELQGRRSVSPHDALGASLLVQVKQDKVMRVLPFENEEVNECWLSDKDRFSYEALNSTERLLKPMLKQGGEWQEVTWNVALDYVAHGLKDIAAESGSDALAALTSPHSTLEELALLAKLMRGLGSDHIDCRLRQCDFSTDGQRLGAPWLGLRLNEIADLDAVLVVGSFLRQESPLLAQRLRQAAKGKTKVSLLSVGGEAPFIRLDTSVAVAPSQLAAKLAAVLKAAAEEKGASVPEALRDIVPCAETRRMAAALLVGEKKAVLLGNVASQSPFAGALHALAAQLAELTGASLGFIGEAANSVGGYLVKAVPEQGGRMFERPMQACVLLGVEPELDCADGVSAMAALKQAKTVIVLSAFKSAAALDYADVLLPLAPFTETSGTFVNCEGRVQSFQAVVKAAGEARPGWKVLRVLGNLLGLEGFEYESSEAVRDEVLGSGAAFAAGLDNGMQTKEVVLPVAVQGIERIADIPAYFADPLVRRASSLQKSEAAATPVARMAAETLKNLGLTAGDKVRVRQGQGSAELLVVADDSVPPSCVQVAGAHLATAGLGRLSGSITVERA
ncbi:MAG: NADH-quinone oxidoreductase subunit [Proteobacteria bacterium]|nr:NADH-quinone oxidoreductase subunit [Pseudomonadota bacterium]